MEAPGTVDESDVLIYLHLWTLLTACIPLWSKWVDHKKITFLRNFERRDTGV